LWSSLRPKVYTKPVSTLRYTGPFFLLPPLHRPLCFRHASQSNNISEVSHWSRCFFTQSSLDDDYSLLATGCDRPCIVVPSSTSRPPVPTCSRFLIFGSRHVVQRSAVKTKRSRHQHVSLLIDPRRQSEPLLCNSSLSSPSCPFLCRNRVSRAKQCLESSEGAVCSFPRPICLSLQALPSFVDTPHKQ
jgi:hypothetical protein